MFYMFRDHFTYAFKFQDRKAAKEFGLGKYTMVRIDDNRTRDKEEQHQLAAMGWHCITVWECQLKPKVREKTLESLAFTLNSIFILNHGAKSAVKDIVR